jgi:chorismate-pyruvate lyase
MYLETLSQRIHQILNKMVDAPGFFKNNQCFARQVCLMN